jgi:hypothetical protein
MLPSDEQNENKHFDLIEYNLLKSNQEKYSTSSDWNSKYITSFESGLNSKDKLGIDMETRFNIYNPLYYLSDYYDGCNTLTVAKYLRI